MKIPILALIILAVSFLVPTALADAPPNQCAPDSLLPCEPPEPTWCAGDSRPGCKISPGDPVPMPPPLCQNSGNGVCDVGETLNGNGVEQVQLFKSFLFSREIVRKPLILRGE